MKSILLTLILCTNIFGATGGQQQNDLGESLPSNPSEEEQQIAYLEQTVFYLSLKTILNFFKPEIHEIITPSIQEALSETDPRNISHIVQSLTEKFKYKHDNETSPEAIKHLIIGINAGIEAAMNLMEERSHHQEEEAAPPIATPIAATTAVDGGKEPLAAPSNIPSSVPVHAPIAAPQQALQSPHAPVNEQLAVQKAPSPVAHHPLRHQATRNPNLKIGI